MDSTITQLFKAGKTQTEIVSITGASKGTVYRVLTGTKRTRMRAQPTRDVAVPFERCRGCGGKVQMPCVACAVLA